MSYHPSLPNRLRDRQPAPPEEYAAIVAGVKLEHTHTHSLQKILYWLPQYTDVVCTPCGGDDHPARYMLCEHQALGPKP